MILTPKHGSDKALDASNFTVHQDRTMVHLVLCKAKATWENDHTYCTLSSCLS
jgi:hypothetical protein